MSQRRGIVSLSAWVGNITASECRKRGIPFETPVMVGMSSGLDVALTLLEGAHAEFPGLTREDALRVVTYFREEAQRTDPALEQIRIWYLAWAAVVEAEFVSKHQG